MKATYFLLLPGLLFLVPLLSVDSKKTIITKKTETKESEIFPHNDVFPGKLELRCVAYNDRADKSGNSESHVVTKTTNAIVLCYRLRKGTVEANTNFYAGASIEWWIDSTSFEPFVDVSGYHSIRIDIGSDNAREFKVQPKTWIDSVSRPREFRTYHILTGQRYIDTGKTVFIIPFDSLRETNETKKLLRSLKEKGKVVEKADFGKLIGIDIQTPEPADTSVNHEYYTITRIAFIKDTTIIDTAHVPDTTGVLIRVLLIICCLAWVTLVLLYFEKRSDKKARNRGGAGIDNNGDGSSSAQGRGESGMVTIEGLRSEPAGILESEGGINTPLPLTDEIVIALNALCENPNIEPGDIVNKINETKPKGREWTIGTLGKKIPKDLPGMTATRLIQYFVGLDYRKKHPGIRNDELPEHINKVLSSAHQKLGSYKDLQEIYVTLEKKCPEDMLKSFRKKYKDIHF